jgi:hypothetical protein
MVERLVIWTAHTDSMGFALAKEPEGIAKSASTMNGKYLITNNQSNKLASRLRA